RAPGELRGEIESEELVDGLDVLPAGQLGDVSRRFDAEHRDAAPDVVAQQIAVVAGDLDDQRARGQLPLLDEPLRNGARIGDGRIREGREIDVIAEEELVRNVFDDLNQRAAAAENDVERHAFVAAA